MELPLVPFEHYMLLDDRPGWPMTCWYRYDFEGRFDPQRLEGALNRAAARHPLLSARVQVNSSGRLAWRRADGWVSLMLLEGDEIPDFNQAIDPRLRSPWGAWLRQGDHASTLWTGFHHCAVDGIAAIEFLRGALHELSSPSTFHAAPVAQEEWMQRDRCGKMRGLQRFRQIGHMVERAVRYFVTTPTTLGDLALQRNAAGAADQQMLSQSLGPVETLKSLARDHQCTINDVMLCGIAAALFDWIAEYGATQRPRIRLFIPMDLRDGPCAIVCNQVGMVHLDIVPGDKFDWAATLHSIKRQTARFRRFRLGRTLLEVIGLACRLTGSPRVLLTARRSAATAVYSNLGEISFADLNRLPLPQDGDLVPLLKRMDAYTPIRPGTPANLAVLSLNGELRVSIRFDRRAVSEVQASYLLSRLQAHLREKKGASSNGTNSSP